MCICIDICTAFVLCRPSEYLKLLKWMLFVSHTGFRRYKSRVKHRNTLGCLYVQGIETVKQSRPWRSLGKQVCAEVRDRETIGLCNSLAKLFPYCYYICSLVDKPGIKLSPHDYYVFSLVDKPSIHDIWNFKLNLTMKLNINQNNRDINQCVWHLWSTFGYPSLNRWWVKDKVRVDTQTRGQTHRQRKRQYLKAKTSLGWNEFN